MSKVTDINKYLVDKQIDAIRKEANYFCNEELDLVMKAVEGYSVQTGKEWLIQQTVEIKLKTIKMKGDHES